MSGKIVARAAVVALAAVSVLAPSAVEAQHRRRVVVVRPFGYAPYGPFGFGYGWGYGYGPYFPAYGYGPYGPGLVDDTASARLLVKPQQTEVYVDGYRAGVVDDYDGVFQSLRLPPGRHEIALYLEGHRTLREKVFLGVGSTLKLRHTMQALPAGESAEPRPVPPPRRRPRKGTEVTDAEAGR
jgi:hypothetical protein